MDNILPFRADYYPILGQLMNEIDLPQVINQHVESPNSQAKLDPGTFIALMIHNILGDVNIRLYKMDNFFKDKALPLFIPWNPNIDLDEINDDRAGRVLDALWKADPKKVFDALALEVIRVHSLETDEIHGDTTSKSFQGAYKNQIEKEDVPFITYGYPKDHRPDLKQLLFGVRTTSDGIPVIGEVANGNESDMTVNGRWIKNLRSILRKETDDYLLYVADSAVVTNKNLDLINRPDIAIDLISRLPGRFGIEKELKVKACAEDRWESIGKLSEEKKAASYDVQETTGEINDRAYRFIVVRSDHNDKRKLKTLDRGVKREREKTVKELKKLNKRPFACSMDAEIETKKFLNDTNIKYHNIDWKIEAKKEKVKRKKRGRLPKGESIPYRTNYYLSGELKKDKITYAREQELCGLFVLITTLLNVEKYSSKTILEKYKGQGNVERIFRFIKNPAWIGAFCLKKPERLAALGYILLMAAMVYTLWERRVRKALAVDGVEPIRGLNRQKTEKPTTYALQTVLSSILVLSQRIGNKLRIWLPQPLSLNRRRVLELSGFSDDLYRVEWNIS